MKLLIIEDQFSLADAMRAALEKNGFIVEIITDGQEGEYEALTGTYDLIILDVMLPHKNGFSILETVKSEIDTPIIIVTAKGALDDKLNGLRSGADDYITKPFHMKELLARVNTVLRRTAHTEKDDSLCFGDLSLDIHNFVVTCGDKQLVLTGKSFQLLEALALQRGNVLNREQLIVKIWGYDSEVEYNNVEVYVSFLRKKLKLLQSIVKVTTIRGVGYKLEVKNA